MTDLPPISRLSEGNGSAPGDLSADYQRMAVTIYGLPDCNCQCQNWHQEKELESFKNFWKWVSFRIDYLQRIQLGCSPERALDPCKSSELAPALAEWIDVFSFFLFQILQLLIGNPGEKVTGFTLVRDWAATTGRAFPFESPMELFTQICREHASQGWIVSLETPPSIGEMRHDWRKESAFLRGRLEEDESEKILQSYSQEDWILAWIAAIYHYRFKKQLRVKFKEFLQAHKDLVAFLASKKPRHGARHLMPGRDKHQRPIDPKTRRLLDLERTL